MARSRREMAPAGEGLVFGRMKPSVIALAALMEATGTGCDAVRSVVGEALTKVGEHVIDERGTPRGIEGEHGIVQRFLYPEGTSIASDPDMVLSLHTVTAPRTAGPQTLHVRVGTEILQRTEGYLPQEVDVTDGTLNTRSDIRLRTTALSPTVLGQEGTHLDLRRRIDDLDLGRTTDTDAQSVYARSIWLNVVRLGDRAGEATSGRRSADGMGETQEQAVADALFHIQNQTTQTPERRASRLGRLDLPSAPGARADTIGRVRGLDDEQVVYGITSAVPGPSSVQHQEIVVEGIDGVEREGQVAQGFRVRVYYHSVAPVVPVAPATTPVGAR